MKPVEAKKIICKQAVFKASDDMFAIVRKRRPRTETIFMGRYPNGDLAVMWQDPRLEVISLGSAKERRALWARGEAAKASLTSAANAAVDAVVKAGASATVRAAAKAAAEAAVKAAVAKAPRTRKVRQ